MKVATQLSVWRAHARPLCVAIGFFDGVHRGHARVIGAAIRRARTCGGEAWVLTFDPHPAHILHPPAAPRLLTPLPHKLRAIAALGTDGCMVLPFTRTLATRAANDFLERLLREAPMLDSVFVGPNWRFGRNRAGSPAMLAAYGQRHGYRTVVVRPARLGGLAVSSTRVRDAVHGGRLAAATAMLGRPFSVVGTVVRGKQLGRKLGYPTANLAPANDVLPPYGIYAVHVRLGRQLHAGVLSFGVRPTVKQPAHAAAVLEAHLFDFAGNLYGRELEVFFVRRLRNERKFPSLTALQAQMARDAHRARRLLRAGKSTKESRCSF